MPFVAVNCAALVETLLEAELFGIEDRTATGVRGRRGKFELADGGSLFLDEIGDLSATAQAKLLRVLQEMTIDRVGGHSTQRVDVRIIAATNRSLRTLVDEGRFRLDLYYRLSCLDIRVPPLRARRCDIPELVSLFLGRHADRPGTTVSPETMEALMQYDWPGNVRELERVIQRAAILAESSCIALDDLPPAVSARYLELFQPALDHGETLRALMARYVRLMLHRCNNNKREACRRLDISYHTLQAYLRFPIRAPEPGAASPALDEGCASATMGELPAPDPSKVELRVEE
jgi:transcriptional regulator with PAS, ATPase and Fis domain